MRENIFMWCYDKGLKTLNTMVTLETTLRQTHDWAVDRIHTLCETNFEDAQAIQSEFSEWLNPDIPDHDIFSLEFIGEGDDTRPSQFF
jgi:hypothetical protein